MLYFIPLACTGRKMNYLYAQSGFIGKFLQFILENAVVGHFARTPSCASLARDYQCHTPSGVFYSYNFSNLSLITCLFNPFCILKFLYKKSHIFINSF